MPRFICIFQKSSSGLFTRVICLFTSESKISEGLNGHRAISQQTEARATEHDVTLLAVKKV